jgi:hypothetical protein
MNHPLRCRCGALRGHVVPASSALRAVCYCRDCQAYARALGTPGILDEHGGTSVVASLPHRVHLTGGVDALACLSLRQGGLLRWYAACCNTPIGNTPRNPALPYVGVLDGCLEGTSPTIERSFGDCHVAVNTKSASGEVHATPVAAALGVLGLAASAVRARFTDTERQNPFFVPGTDTPIRPVRVLSAEERERAYGGR